MSNFDEQFPKQYDAASYEESVYKKWEESGAFMPEKQRNTKGTYTNILPPPNANGELHIGHVVGYSVMDMMGRISRMMGKQTLLIPGKDHAGIQTQVVYEKMIKQKRGLTRADLGREKFYKEIYDFCIDRSAYMRNQEKQMGLAADWSREKFTLDPKISRVVQETFVRMYDDGLIYRGERIINWCPGCMTALSDLEVKYKKEITPFYYFRYGPVVIGTARPETKFQDKIIVAHPDDKRYKKYFGKTITVPWINGNVEATFLADESVDPSFGTGAMTITPAHSFEDFAIAKKHKLPIVQIIDEHGNLTEAAGPDFVGKNARQSREKIVEILKEKGLLVKVDEKYEHNLSVCERSDDPIEPLVSKQWFVNVDHKKFSLKKEAIKAIKTGKLKMYPRRFESLYIKWMEDLYDWNISRQIWWGHRIPVYYCEQCGNEKPIVSVDAPKKCPQCHGANFTQDSDTLDTWFSSGQWAFTTLGFSWNAPLGRQSQDFRKRFPSDLMIMGRDLMFFWNARMIMMSLYATKKVPYQRVYFTGLLRDKAGKKMSKSRGNGIDPVAIIKKYGADALRLSLLANSTAGNDFRMYEEKIESYRNFTNKLWNIARFIEMRKQGSETGNLTVQKKNLTIADQWILSRLESVANANAKDLSLDRLEISLPATRLYDFVWNDFADWYLEAKKAEDPQGNDHAVLSFVLENILKMLHPYIPYVTEVLWEKTGHTTLLLNERLKKLPKFANAAAEKLFAGAQEAIKGVRTIRAEYHIDPKTELTLFVEQKSKLLQQKEIIEKLARCVMQTESPKMQALSRVVGKEKIAIDVAGKIDVAKEQKKTSEEIERLEKMIRGFENQLKNKNFVERAPQEIVESIKEKLETQRQKHEEMQHHAEELNRLLGE